MSSRLPSTLPADPATRAEYEAQATACLAAAEHYREYLLALAYKLTGDNEQGMDLFQQTVLDCHDAIQRNGFAGDKYQFYLYTSLRNRFRKQQGQRGKREVLVDFQAADSNTDLDGRDDEGSAPWATQALRLTAAQQVHVGAGPAPEVDAHAQLAEQVMAEAREQFSFADRLALRLHVEGMTYQAIADHLGLKEKTYVWRRIDRMRTHLQKAFAQAWDALQDSTWCLLL